MLDAGNFPPQFQFCPHQREGSKQSHSKMHYREVLNGFILLQVNWVTSMMSNVAQAAHVTAGHCPGIEPSDFQSASGTDLTRVH